MVRLLSIVTLILTLILFPPAALAVISNNAVPGDTIYPIKRGLENIIFAVASINPTSKAWFAAARSDRRFKEINILAERGEEINQTLDELVKQTQLAADQITKVNDQTRKSQLAEKLSESIKKYDQGLSELPQESIGKPLSQTLQPTSTPTPTVSPRSTTTPQPTLTPQPSPTPQPPPPPPSNCDDIQDPITRARCKLREIEQGLGAAGFNQENIQNKDQGKSEDQGHDTKKDKKEKENEQSLSKQDEFEKDFNGKDKENRGKNQNHGR